MKIEPECQANAEVIADEFHLTNTVYNVLDNAEKYSKDHPEIIHQSTAMTRKMDLLISIRDAGIGIKEEFQQFVFRQVLPGTDRRCAQCQRFWTGA